MKLYYFDASGYMPIEIMEAEVERETPKTYVLKRGRAIINKATMVRYDYHFSTTYEEAVKAAIGHAKKHIFLNKQKIGWLTEKNEYYSARIAELQKILEDGNGQ